MKVFPKTDAHNEIVREDLISQFGSEYIISIKNQYKEAHKLDGFLAEEEEGIIGVLLYKIGSSECELVYIHTGKPGKGIGKLLIGRLIELLKSLKIKRLWVITTNDNLEALAFYQKQGFKISKVYPGEMDKVRKKKPFIPTVGKNGIPLRDMLELKMEIVR